MTNEQYYSLIQPYKDANQILMTRLEMLNHNLYNQEADPIHMIQDRIKEKKSIEDKLKRLNSKGGVEDARAMLADIAGIRIICYFVSDIHNLVSALKKQSDLVLIKEKDYITTPKPNGYRSYHVVFGVPVYYMKKKEYYPVEVQLRTMSMDFWASMEHRICYKKTRDNPTELKKAFCQYSEVLHGIEDSFEAYSEMYAQK
ncbi:MAG: (p)ppGpp synthetase [Lachnospiraceae bacterium]|nr:(p)ppGpp synthetase [Lachnospiraceae bacterium]